MNKLTLNINYRDNDLLRNSFMKLAAETFGLNFNNWHEKGYWGECYIPYSYADGDRIVANVSVNKLDLIIEGNRYKALQIGTVMTQRDYRNKGLSRRLMNHILEEYKDAYDFMYLFANESVLDFYPRFGFERAEEYQYSLSYSLNTNKEIPLQKLDITDREDLKLIEKTVLERMPASQLFSTDNSAGITMYHCLNVFNDALYYHPQEDAIVIYSKDNYTIQLFDVISKQPVNIENIMAAIADEKTSEITFHYTPDYDSQTYDRRLFQGDGTLFVKTNGGLRFPLQVKHPVTSEA